MSIVTSLEAAAAKLSPLRKIAAKYAANHWLKFLTTLFVTLALNHLNAFNHALDFLGRGHVAEVTTTYLHNSKVKISETLLLLAALDAGLEVLKSSTAGISFIVDVQVQIGGLFGAMQGHIQNAVRASLWALGNVFLTEELLKAINYLSIPLLTASIITFAKWVLFRNFWLSVARFFRKSATVFILLTLLAHIGIPLALYATAIASETVSAPMGAKANQHFTDIHHQFAIGQKEDIHAHVKDVITTYKSSSNDLHSKTRSTGQSLVQHIIGLLLSAFVFPVSFTLGLGWLFLLAIRHLLFQGCQG